MIGWLADWLFAALVLFAANGSGAEPPDGIPAAIQWRGPLADTNLFPTAVWLQDPENAARFKAAGINLYVGLWQGPTEAQLSALKSAGMPVICAQNPAGLARKDDPEILAWMQDDEPDNAQARPLHLGYGPPVPPASIVQKYREMHAADPSRPVLLNLGQGVAWDNYNGRGSRTRHPEDYLEYLRGCDIASFDIYPVVHDNSEVAGKLEFVARGVERLVEWTGGAKPAWCCIECTHINNAKAKATPAQVRTEVWMALIQGAQGLVYFVHEFKPKFKEAAVLDDPPMLEAITALNRQIRGLAPVLHLTNLPAGVSVKSSAADAPIAFMAKRDGTNTWLFTVAMRNRPARGSFELSGISADSTAEVLGESRSIVVRDGKFQDDFKGYEPHIYRIQ